MEKFWLQFIAQGNPEIVQQITEEVVLQLEMRCPRYDSSDRDHISQLLYAGRIFPLQDKAWREQLFYRLCKLPYFIPSFFTFFADINVLAEYSRCILRLVGRPKKSVTESLREAFKGSDSFDAARLRLWIFARAHFQQMPVHPQKPDTQLLAKIRPNGSNQSASYEFASYAKQLKFETDRINSLVRAGRPETCSSCSSGEPPSSKSVLRHRCGFPDEASFKHDKTALTLKWLCAAPSTSDSLESFYAVWSPMRIFHIGETDALWDGAEEVILQQYNDHANQTELARTTDEMMADAEPCTQIATTQVPGSTPAASGLRKRRREDDDLETLNKQPGSILFKKHVGFHWEIECEANEESTEEAARGLQERGWYLFGPKLNADGVHLSPVGAPMNCYDNARHSDINTIVITRAPKVSNIFAQECKSLYTGEDEEL